MNQTINELAAWVGLLLFATQHFGETARATNFRMSSPAFAMELLDNKLSK